MRTIAKFFLWLTTIALPVVIAACYGMPYRFSKTGHVVDSETKEGILGIEVACMRAGSAQATAYTLEDGSFWLEFNDPCDHYRVEDVDGEDNGGQYVSRDVEWCKDCEEITIELHK